MEKLIIDNIYYLCKEYNLGKSMYNILSVSLEFDIQETIDIIHDIIFTNIDNNTPDIAYKILSSTTRLSKPSLVDSLFKFIKEQKQSKNLVSDIDDMYILLNAMRMIGLSDAIICKHFLDIYLPYKDITTPFSRDNLVRTRYICDIIDDIIYVNVPSSTRGYVEELNNLHIYLAIEQNGRK